MAIDPNIKQKAENIRLKKKGREVRESLAAGLESMSEDVVETVDRQDYVESQFQEVIDNTTGKDVISAPELIAARNGEANLKARLDKEQQDVNAQLADKADDKKTTDELNKKRDKSVSIGLNDFSSEALGAMTGQNEISLLSTPRDYSVAPIKTTYYNVGKNLVNLNDLTTRTILSLTGAEASNSSYDTTKMTIVPVGKEMTITKGYRASFYNDSGAHVQTFEIATTPTFVTPTSYMKLSFLNGDMDKVQVEINSVATSYERPYQYLSKRELERGNQAVDTFTLKDFDYLRGYITSSTGGYTASPGYSTSKLIKLEKGDLFTADAKGSSSVAILTKWSITNNVETFVKNIAVGTNGNDTIKVSYEATENVEYIRVCTVNNGTTGFVSDTFASAKIEKYHAQFKLVDDVNLAKKDISELKSKEKEDVSSIAIRKPVINFQFDDGKVTDVNVYNVFKQYGLVCGFAIVSTNTRVDEYLSYQEEGFEIIAHSTSGLGMNDPTMTDVEQRLKESKEVLESKGFNIKGWVTPSSVMHSSFIPLVKKYYEYATTVGDNGLYNVLADSSRKLRRVSMESRTLEELKAIVDEAILNTGCLTFYAHDYPDANAPFLTEETLTGLLAYVKQKVDNGEVITGRPIDVMNHYFTVRHEDLVGLLA